MTNDVVLTDIFGTPFSLVDKRQAVSENTDKIFIIKPYLQLGRHFNEKPGSLVLFFHPGKKYRGKDWLVQYRQPSVDGDNWRDASLSRGRLRLISGKRHWRYRAELTGLSAGEPFQYRVVKAWTLVFSGEAVAPSAEKTRIAVLGDMADGGQASADVARAMLASRPELLLAVGDIVYDKGLVSEYLAKFFPVYNESVGSCSVPLLSSLPLAPVIGNHDIGTPGQQEKPDFDHADALGCCKFFENPRGNLGLKRKQLKKSLSSRRAAFIDSLPRGFFDTANYSFSWGSIFVLVLDANRYMDWTLPALQRFVERKLSEAPAGAWKIVAFHQAPFNDDFKYAGDQRMRVLSPLFEAAGVVLVFSGHCHYYARTHAMRYGLTTGVVEKDGSVAGTASFEKDGKRSSGGVTYVITGAGGKLVDRERMPGRSDYVAFLDTSRYSFSLLEADANKLEFKQVDKDGNVIDELVLSFNQDVDTESVPEPEQALVTASAQ